MSAQEFLDIGKNLVCVREHLIIPESKYAIAARSEIRCADFIVARPIRMLAAIDFDYQSAFNRAKINEIGTDRKLTPELNFA
jgi:hypothetical protein